MIDLLVQF